MLQLIHAVLHALDHACPAVEERTARLTLPPAADGILPTYALGRQNSLITAWRIPCRRSRSISPRVNPRHTCANIWIDVRGCFKPMAKLPTAFLAQANCIQANPAQKNQQAAGV